MRKEKSNEAGFTLIEMIGVLAIIAVLVGAIAPKIFNAIKNSKITTTATLAKNLQSACAEYYASIGTLLPVDPASNTGIPEESDNHFSKLLVHTKTPAQDNGKWSRFRGPYLEKFEPNNPPFGESMDIAAWNALNYNGNSTSGNVTNYAIIPGSTRNSIADGATIVSLVIKGVSIDEWKQFESIYEIDMGTAGDNETERKNTGYVKYDGSTMRVYIVHN